MFRPSLRARTVVLVLIDLFLISSLTLPAFSEEKAIGNAPEMRGYCPNCHQQTHPVSRMDLPHPAGECLLCHNEGVIPDELVLKAIKISAASSKNDRKESSRSEMVKIPAGDFIMGEDYVKKAVGPKHKAFLDDYLIDRFDVTNRQYEEFVNKTGRVPPKHWMNKRVLIEKKDHPVTYVSWFDAEAYCEWRGKRLPTEMEWEKAARGVDGRIFPWGNEFVKEYANVYMLGIGDTTPVGQFEKGKSPYGVYDMAGNVFQWTFDWFKPYPNNPHLDNPNYGETHKVLRGGSFYDCSYYKCGPSFQAFNRIALSPKTISVSIGFRCAKSLVRPGDLPGL